MWSRHKLLTKQDRLLRLEKTTCERQIELNQEQIRLLESGRFNGTVLEELFRVLGRTKFYESIQEMQNDLDAYVVTYNTQKPHQGRGMNGRTPADVFPGCLTTPDQERPVSGEYPISSKRLAQPDWLTLSRRADKGFPLSRKPVWFIVPPQLDKVVRWEVEKLRAAQPNAQG